MAYCDEDDVRSAGNYWAELSEEAQARLAPVIAQAQKFVDQQTGSFFEPRTLTVTTEPVSPTQKRLFMPAPVISLTSVTEGGVDITSSTLNYGNHLEKNAQAFGVSWPGDAPASYWLQQQQSVVVVGSFGYNETPADITAATAFVAAALMGWVEKSYVDSNGLSSAFRDNVFPPWLKDTLDDYSLSPYDAQPMMVVES